MGRAKKNGKSVSELVPMPRNERRFAMESVSKKMDKWRPAAEVLLKINSVQTIFPQFDKSSRILGLPLQRYTLVHGESAAGKAQSVDSKVLTPQGWRRIGDLKKGDRICGIDGGGYKVSGVFPQGIKETFRVGLSDGTSTICSEDHLWLTITENEKFRHGVGTVKTLGAIMKTKRLRIHELPDVAAIEFDRLGDLPLHPHLMGLLLGDGSFRYSTLTFSNPEKDLLEKVRSQLPIGDELRGGGKGGLSWFVCGGRRGRVKKTPSRTVRAIKSLGLFGLYSEEKFIPECYMRASIDERLDLLRGLVDSDGHVDKKGFHFEYSSSSDRLAADVTELIRSLGGVATCKMRQTKFTATDGSKKNGLPSWRILGSFGNGVVPVSSKKHLKRWKSRSQQRRRAIVEIVPVGEKQCVCIATTAPDRLYITDGYIPTHNSLYVIGLILAFLQQDHFACFLDSEMTTSISWLKKLMGDYASNPTFMAKRPRSYEEADDAVRQFANMVGDARSKGMVPPDTAGIIVVDSLQKLVPKKLFDKLLKEGSAKAGIDGMNGMAGAVQAGLNKQWLNEIIPLMHDTNCAFVAISRESEDRDATAMDRMYGNAYKIQGGKSVVYDSSLSIRIIHAKNIYHGSEEDKNMIGERHLMRIWRSKVAGRDQKTTDCYFHTSNGNFIPEGFDRARDVLELAKDAEIVKGESWLSWGNVKLGQGENQAVKRLTENPEMLRELETQVRAGFVHDDADAEPEEEVVVPPPRRKKKAASSEA